MDNPTGCLMNKLDDADQTARDLVSYLDQLFMQGEYFEAEGRAKKALREAEKRGMMRAAEIARSYHGSGASGKTIANTIERAAKEESNA